MLSRLTGLPRLLARRMPQNYSLQALPPLRAVLDVYSKRMSTASTPQQPPPRPVATAAAAEGAGGSAPVTTSSSSTPSGGVSYKEWRAQWIGFLQQIFEQGHFSADPGARYDALAANVGAMKRGVLSLARARPDILYTLQPAKLQALVKAGFPVDDRKTKNAHRRLQASILEGRHLAPADGGAAEFQDLMRVFLSLAACDERDASLFRPLMSAATALLPDVRAAAAAEPSPDAQAAAEAAHGAPRYMPTKRLPEEAQGPRQGSRSSSSSSGYQRGAQGSGGRAGRRLQQQQGEGRGEGMERLEQWWYEGPRRGEGSERSSSSSSRGSSGGRGGGGRSGGGRGGGRGDAASRQQRAWQQPGRARQQEGGASGDGTW